jgi:ABC-2 type transport system permease protein
MGIPLTLADYRQKKILKRFKVTPTSPIKLLIAQGFTQFLTAVVSSSLVFLVASFAFGFKIIGSPLKFILAYLLVLITLYSIGMLVGSLAPNMKVANTVCTLLYFPMLFLSGATIPYEIMPKGLQIAANIFPLTQGIKLLKGIVVGMPEGNFVFQFFLMLSISIICLSISLKCFKWE